MKRSKFSDEQILAIVKEGEAGRKVADLCRTHGITEQTYYRWKAKYDGLERSELQRLKQVEDENRRLKQIVAEQTLDIQALKRSSQKSGRPHRSARGGGVAADARKMSRKLRSSFVGILAQSFSEYFPEIEFFNSHVWFQQLP